MTDTSIESIVKAITDAKLEMIERLEADAERVMLNGRYVDRWITLMSGGQAYFTTRDSSQIQHELPVLMDLDRPLHRDEIREAIITALAECIHSAEATLIDSYSGDELGTATPEELLESWLAGPEGHIHADIEGEQRTVYAAI